MNPLTVNALSISSSVSCRLAGAILEGVVIHSHMRSCSVLLGPHGTGNTTAPLVITLAERSIENGPLNILLEDFPAIRNSFAVGAPVYSDGVRLQLAHVEIFLQTANQWDPRLDRTIVRAARARSSRMHSTLLDQTRSLAPQASLLDLLGQTSIALNSAMEARFASHFASILREMEHKSETSLRNSLAFGAEHLAGLGVGLTPAGDDFLCGAMLAVWLMRDDAAHWCDLILDIASARTTTLSAALLRESANGHCSASWQRFFSALASDDSRAIELAIAGVLSHGATSGGDSLAGFFWTIGRLAAVNHADS